MRLHWLRLGLRLGRGLIEEGEWMMDCILKNSHIYSSGCGLYICGNAIMSR